MDEVCSLSGIYILMSTSHGTKVTLPMLLSHKVKNKSGIIHLLKQNTKQNKLVSIMLLQCP